MASKSALLISFIILLSQSLRAEESLSYLNRILGNIEESRKRLSKGTYLLPDDPANFAVYEKLEAHLRELETIISNQSDMISYYRTTEGFLKHITDSLQNIRELVVKRGNFLYMGENREYIDLEIDQYYRQILFTLKNAEFNKKRIFENLFADSSLQVRFQGEEYYELANVDRLLKFFIRQRVLFGTRINALHSRNRGLAVGAENLKGFQSRVRDINVAKEITHLKRHHLLLIINLLLF